MEQANEETCFVSQIRELHKNETTKMIDEIQVNFLWHNKYYQFGYLGMRHEGKGKGEDENVNWALKF